MLLCWIIFIILPSYYPISFALDCSSQSCQTCLTTELYKSACYIEFVNNNSTGVCTPLPAPANSAQNITNSLQCISELYSWNSETDSCFYDPEQAILCAVCGTIETASGISTGAIIAIAVVVPFTLAGIVLGYFKYASSIASEVNQIVASVSKVGVLPTTIS
jgi:hypothetical protein